jgi:hypothetical protein
VLTFSVGPTTTTLKGTDMTTITARTRYPKGAIFYYEPAVRIYRGTLVPNPDWIAADCITIERADGSLSIIPKRDLVGNLDSQALQARGTVYAMYGSKGDLYTVTDDGRFWSCTCRGFEFRKTCKHIVETRNQVNAAHADIQ